MANLLGQNIGTNYKGILNLNTLNGNLSGTLQAVTDGDGNASALKLSSTGVDVGTFVFLGGTDVTFPAIKRNSAAIDFRLANDSGYASINLRQSIGYNSSNVLRYKFGDITGGSGVSTREGEFAIGLIDASQNAGLRILALSSGSGYIDGYSEGGSKADNYPVFLGSRVNNTGSAIVNSTTQENGTQFIFGYAVNEASSLVTINSTTRGFLPPRMTEAQRDLIASPATGLVIYNTTTNVLNFYNGSAWGAV